MNDFTKEELEEILMGYQMHAHNTRHNFPSLDLCKKLRDLIDNYCEHELKKPSRNAKNKKQISCLQCGYIVWIDGQ